MALEHIKSLEKQKTEEQAKFKESTAVFQSKYSAESKPTAISEDVLRTIVDGLTRVPEGFHILPKVKRMLIDRRHQIFNEGGPYDWGFAESLAFGSLLLENIPVRLSGQDSRRGTFGQRHAYWYDAKTGDYYNPLMHLAEKQARICVYNSLLSEAAVLGFDYGYSLDYPNMLCLWEAQFGDFANGRKPSSTNLSSRLNQSGSARVASSCFYLTATRGRARNIPAPASNDSCKRVPRITSRSAIPPRPRSIFTSCGGK